MTESEKYLNALQKGDRKTTQEIYHKYYRKVENFVLRNNGKEQEAKDVFHDALMYLIVTSKKRTLQLHSFEGYLFTICKNIWKNELRNKSKEVIKDEFFTLPSKEYNLSKFIVQQQKNELYKDSFGKLSSNCKDVLSAYFNGISYQELTTEFSYATLNTARQRVFRCKTKLIKLIKDDSRYNKLK